MAQSALSNLATARAMSFGFPTAPYLALNASLGSPFSVIVIVGGVGVVASSGMIDAIDGIECDAASACVGRVWVHTRTETRAGAFTIGHREGVHTPSSYSASESAVCDVIA